MTQENLFFDLFQGESHILKMSAFDEDSTGQLTVKDLTFVDDIVFVLSEEEDSDALLTKMLGGDILVTDPAGGLYEIRFDPADTAQIDPAMLRFEIRMTEGNDQEVVGVGLLELKKSSTVS